MDKKLFHSTNSNINICNDYYFDHRCAYFEIRRRNDVISHFLLWAEGNSAFFSFMKILYFSTVQERVKRPLRPMYAHLWFRCINFRWSRNIISLNSINCVLNKLFRNSVIQMKYTKLIHRLKIKIIIVERKRIFFVHSNY